MEHHQRAQKHGTGLTDISVERGSGRSYLGRIQLRRAQGLDPPGFAIAEGSMVRESAAKLILEARLEHWHGPPWSAPSRVLDRTRLHPQGRGTWTAAVSTARAVTCQYKTSL